VKSIASLFAFFGLFFPIFFILSLGAGFLSLWLEAVSSVPVRETLILSDIVNSIQWALPFTLYVTIVFSMNYAKRHKTPGIAVFFIIVILSAAFMWGGSKGLYNARTMLAPPFIVGQQTQGKPGLILEKANTTFVLLDEPSLETGSRVISIPGEPLIFQEVPITADGSIIKAPSLPFRYSERRVSNEFLDLSLSAEYISKRYDQGLFSFGMWILALILLLTALGFIFQIGKWHLANIFLGLLIFRGILAFEVFLNSAPIQEYLVDFFRGAFPRDYISPFILAVIALLVLVYVVLYSLAAGERGKDASI
jgi:hypothetical protein